MDVVIFFQFDDSMIQNHFFHFLFLIFLLEGHEVFFIARHGKGHTFTPSGIPHKVKKSQKKIETESKLISFF